MYQRDENSTQVGFLIGGIVEFIVACGFVVLVKRYFASHFHQM
jgi:phosphate starvation-inducible membrane PsiE